MSRCEHYHFEKNRDHFIDHRPGNGLLDTDYLEALFLGDHDAMAEYENAAVDNGIGPQVSCVMVQNFSSVKVNCCK